MPYLPRLALLSLLSLTFLRGDTSLASAVSPTAKQEQQTKDGEVWQVLRPAMLAFQDGAPRLEFLATCKKLQAEYPGSMYEAQLKSLIEPLEREGVAPPTFMQVPASKRTQQETIRYWVFQLREVAGRQWSDPGYPHLFPVTDSDKAAPMATEELVALGTPAIPYLIDALKDDTPTRTIAWQRSFYPVYFVLRRKDLAMKCLERITGCTFYDEGATFIHLHNDTPQRRASALENVRAWWRLSEGQGQAQMIRNQLHLRQTNVTLRGYDEVDALLKLAMLEGPERVLGQMRSLLNTEGDGLNRAIVEAMERVDPQTVTQAAFTRFWHNQSQWGDYTLVLRYGDRALYREVARRYEATGKMSSGNWNAEGAVDWAVRYGRNWAIPLVAKNLELTQMTGSRSGSNIPPQSFSTADVAIEQFQQLTGRDFGYKPQKSEAERLGAIKRASQWWQTQGREALRTTIEAEHKPVEEPGDLFWDEAHVSAVVAHLTGKDDSLRRRTVAGLSKVYSYRVQRALLQVLDMEKSATERVRMLRVLQKQPSIWHLPRLAHVLEGDPDVACRVLASQIIKAVVADKSSSLWWSRLESRDVALNVARRLTLSPSTPSRVRQVSIEVLKAWDSLQDRRVLSTLQLR